MLTAEIARRQLEPNTIERIEELIRYFEEDFPDSSDFISASCFPDDLTKRGLSGFKVWHGILTPYDPDGILSKRERDSIRSLIASNNLHSAINESRQVLTDPAASKWVKAFMLRFLLHCVGDIHQPLHCIQMYSKDFPQGDLAGHLFLIEDPKFRNLHRLWDSILGIGEKKLKRPLCREDALWLSRLADEVTELFPEESLPESANMRVEDWSEESYQLAISSVYRGIRPQETPSDAYISRGRQVALRQLALSGYRLAHLLEELFGHPQGVCAPYEKKSAQIARLG